MALTWDSYKNFGIWLRTIVVELLKELHKAKTFNEISQFYILGTN